MNLVLWTQSPGRTIYSAVWYSSLLCISDIPMWLIYCSRSLVDHHNVRYVDLIGVVVSCWCKGHGQVKRVICRSCITIGWWLKNRNFMGIRGGQFVFWSSELVQNCIYILDIWRFIWRFKSHESLLLCKSSLTDWILTLPMTKVHNYL